jgi:tyrosyl-tRNA synthetase
LLSFETTTTLKKWRAEVEQGLNPRDIKFRLGQEIVARFHGAAAGEAAQAAFIARFQQGAVPEEMPNVAISVSSGSVAIPQLLKEAGLTSSTSEAMRLIRQGGVRLDNEKVDDPGLAVAAGSTHILQVGKRKFARVTLRNA